jgi:hypothetical protein
MFSGWVRYLQLTAKAKTGIGRSVVVYVVIAIICAFTAFSFFAIALFVGLSERWGPLIAAFSLAGAFLLLAVLASLLGVLAQRRASERAKEALERRKASQWFDPALLSTGLQIGRAVGLRRIVPLIAVGVLAATVAKEWFGPQNRQDSEDEGADDLGTS